MIHGDIVTLTADGIVVHGKALQPLGIFDQSICWGVWVKNPHKDHEHYERPNLIISPFHPSSWPFMIRLQIMLYNEKGVLGRACRVIEESDLSILFAECTPDGFIHATWTIIAESTKQELEEFKNKKEAFDKENPKARIPGKKQKAFTEAHEIANLIAACMFAHVREIEEKFSGLLKSQTQKPEAPSNPRSDSDPPRLHEWRPDTDQHFLYDGRKVAQLMQHSKPEGESEEENLAFIKAHVMKPVTVDYMQRLAYFSLYGGGSGVPFSLQYQANSALLMLQKKEIFSEEGEVPLVHLPMPAIASFNSEDKYLRLNPVLPGLLEKKLTRIAVEYGVKENPTRSALASKGLLRLICSELLQENVNLLHISNKWTRYEYSVEAGLISFIADVATDEYPKLEEAILSINRTKPPELERVRIKSAKPSEYPQRKLFVSLHFGHPRENNIRDIVSKVATERGFEEAIVETHVAPATPTILERIGECQAFLQLLSFKAEDKPEETNFSWLDFEYGVASGKGMPTIRLVDVVRVPYERWRSRITINTDQQAREFRSDVSDDELTKQIRGAVEELAGELLRRQVSVG